ncbi:hypothetical protein [Streptosporangium sp. 'caverna']|uniref:hypothetical protein n=1 Tax=Streptosporangium sp. 'caverna' TaxID=2202249 RepID=UPI000D7D4742|nr:hypothetical protein [Streptosporangium sp. 'caverna']AWS46448.1 hypothetical protein DKM19_39245 [Streptosporangium sp. 'caverna']
MRDSEFGSPIPKLELRKDWPGLDEAGRKDGPDVKHAEIRKIIQVLRSELAALKGGGQASMSATWSGPGTLGEIAGLGNVGSAETGTWETADYFGRNITQAYTVLNGKYQAFAEQYEALVVALEKAIRNYEESHDGSSA